MIKKLFASIFIFLFLSGIAYPVDITDLEGITGKIGKEDINWGTGEAADTFAVPTYDGGIITITKLPDIWDYLGTIRPKDVITRGPWVDVRSYASINVAVTAIGATQTTLLVPSAQTLTGNLTIPSTLTLLILKGGSIVKASTYTLAINGPFVAGPYQVFSGFSVGDVTFGPGVIKELYAEWWQNNTTPGTTNMATAIQCAIDSQVDVASEVEQAGGTYLQLLRNIYLCNSAISSNSRKVGIRGSGIHNTTLKKNFNGDLLTLGSGWSYLTIENLTLELNSKTGRGLYINAVYYYEVRNIVIQNGAGTGNANAGLSVNAAQEGKFFNVSLVNNVKNGYIYNTNGLRFYGLNLAGTGGTATDVQFDQCTDLEINGLSVSDDIGVTFSNTTNMFVNGAYLETNLSVAAITIGTTVRGWSLRDIIFIKIPGLVSTAPVIDFILNHGQVGGAGNIDGYHYFGAGTGTHQTGHLYGGGIGTNIKNVTVRNLTATDDGSKLINTGTGSFTNALIENVFAETGGAPTITGDEPGVNFYDSKLINTNVPIILSNAAHASSIENSTGTITITAGGTGKDLILINCTGAITDTDNKSSRIDSGFTSTYKTIASPATGELTLLSGDVFLITGTNNITSIAAASSIRGRRITLIFSGVLTFTDGSNLKLAGNLVTSVDDTITLVSDGTNWYETSRSVN